MARRRGTRSTARRDIHNNKKPTHMVTKRPGLLQSMCAVYKKPKGLSVVILVKLHQFDAPHAIGVQSSGNTKRHGGSTTAQRPNGPTAHNDSPQKQPPVHSARALVTKRHVHTMQSIDDGMTTASYLGGACVVLCCVQEGCFGGKICSVPMTDYGTTARCRHDTRAR